MPTQFRRAQLRLALSLLYAIRGPAPRERVRTPTAPHWSCRPSVLPHPTPDLLLHVVSFTVVRAGRTAELLASHSCSPPRPLLTIPLLACLSIDHRQPPHAQRTRATRCPTPPATASPPAEYFPLPVLCFEDEEEVSLGTSVLGWPATVASVLAC